MNALALSRRARKLALFFFCVVISIGCSAEEEIRSYTVPKDKSAAQTGEASRSAQVAEAPEKAGEPTDRMLGAIVPAGEQTWYFKVVGPIGEIDKHAADIEQFLQSISMPSGASQPKWTTPAGWEEVGASGMRAATLKIPTDTAPLELSVIPLPTTGARNELLENVNRWRGQLQLPPTDESGLEKSIRSSNADGATVTIVDLQGTAAPGGMMAPFAGGGPFSGGTSPSAATPPASGAGRPPGSSGAFASPNGSELPPGHPPIGEQAPSASAAAVPLQFVAPKSWQQATAGGMRKAAFSIQKGDQKAEVTVIDLASTAPSIADPLENVNRWRTELNLGPIEREQLSLENIEVDGRASHYVEVVPDPANPAESQASEATLAASVPVGSMIWFFKLRGDRELVLSERDNFKTFLKSIRIASDGGAKDGDN